MVGRALRQKKMKGTLVAGVRRLCCLCLLIFAACLPLFAQPRQPLSRFEHAVRCVKFFEGWHGRNRHPYVGYGHRLLKGERFTANMTERQADSLLRVDLLSRYTLFRRFGKDALLLTILSYNVGTGTLLGGRNRSKSRLIRKLERGERNIQSEYLSFCRYKGRILPGLLKRRRVEFALFYVP